MPGGRRPRATIHPRTWTDLGRSIVSPPGTPLPDPRYPEERDLLAGLRELPPGADPLDWAREGQWPLLARGLLWRLLESLPVAVRGYREARAEGVPGLERYEGSAPAGLPADAPPIRRIRELAAAGTLPSLDDLRDVTAGIRRRLPGAVREAPPRPARSSADALTDEVLRLALRERGFSLRVRARFSRRLLPPRGRREIIAPHWEGFDRAVDDLGHHYVVVDQGVRTGTGFLGRITGEAELTCYPAPAAGAREVVLEADPVTLNLLIASPEAPEPRLASRDVEPLALRVPLPRS